MAQRLAVDDGLVHCPFRGDIDADECVACPDSRGVVSRNGRLAVVCRPASRFFPPQLVSGW